MNKKHVAACLTKKHRDFVSSIDDMSVRKLVIDNSIITGGAIASIVDKIF